MSNSIPVHETVIPFPRSRAVALDASEREQLDAVTAEFQLTLTREEALRREIGDLLGRQDILTLEFEHRLTKGLELVASLLSLQSQAAKIPEAAEQLSLAARRVGAAGHVHCRLHLLVQ